MLARHSDLWTADVVLLRLIEAADTLDLLPPVKLPGWHGKSWPDYQTYVDADWAAMNEAEQERDKAKWAASFTRRPRPTAGAISRLDDCVSWPARWPDLQWATVWAFAFARARGEGAVRMWRKRGISTRSGYRWLDQAIQSLTVSLNSQSTPLVQADLDRLARLGIISAIESEQSDTRVPSWIRAGDARPSVITRTGVLPKARVRRVRKKKRRQA